MTRPLRLLVVDDESTNRELASLLLVHAGHEVVCCADGREAIALLHEQNQAFDAILLDMVMPLMDGLEVARLLRADARTSHMAIVGVSAKANRRDAKAALEAGCDTYLTKPYRRLQLLEALARALSTPRS